MNNFIQHILRQKTDGRLSFKREWGSETNTTPLSYLHQKPSDKATAFSRIAIVLTLIFWSLYVLSVIIRQLIDGPQNYQFTAEVFGYSILVSFLTLSALMYLIARQGAFKRFKKHARTARRVLEEYFFLQPSSITVLVPSYAEEVSVIRKTILSATLQEHPDIKVVLLLDDNPFTTQPEERERIDKTYALVRDINSIFSTPYTRSQKLLERVDAGSDTNLLPEIIEHYLWSSEWLEEFAKKEVIEDHVDVFFADNVVRTIAQALSHDAEEMVALHKQGTPVSTDRLKQLCQRPLSIFGAQVELFERKRYSSLSHEANKAMNLNSYIGLMGGMYTKEKTPEGVLLMKTEEEARADLIVQESDFILTLDADSVLLPEYCARLVYFLGQPDNQDVAVVQTPYSSFRGAPSRIERLAGATTDIQHLVHQGMSCYNATFWVGANAVIRKKALADIVETEWVGGFEIKRYVQDHTVIEDTESSIDLALHGWRLVNYPERLSYSATPPDFGSLVVQRERWANGGLLILPKLLTLRKKLKQQGRPMHNIEFMMRLTYMTSIAWSSFGLLFVLAYPYDGRLLSPLILLAALPYFIAMAIDLKRYRYHYTDIIRIYGFNLILLPVNLIGTLKSIQQALTTKKIPFARTPKVKNRTATAWFYLVAPLLIVGFSIFTLWRNIEGHNWGNAIFAGFNALAASWAIVAYIGMKNLITDLWLAFVDMLYVDVTPETSPNKSIKNVLGFKWRRALINESH